MTLRVHKILPPHLFDALLSTYTNTNQKDVFPVGMIDWRSLPEFVRDLMQRWTGAIDGLIRSCNDQELREDFFDNRGTTFREYLMLWNNEIPVDQYGEHVAFHWFGLVTDQQRRFFILDRDPTIEGFCRTMQESNLELFAQYSSTVPIALPLELFKRHCYISGLSGSGKSELLKRLLYAFQQSKKCSIVLLDPHGDMAQEVFQLQHQDPDRIVLIDPFLFPGQTPVLNPLQLTHTDDVSVELATQQVVQVFEELIKDAQLSNQMRTVLTPCVGTLLRAGNKNLHDLQRFMSDGNNQDLIALGTQSSNPAHRQFFQSEFNNKNYSITKSSIYTKVFSLLGTQTFFNLTVGSSTFNLEEAIDDHKIIIFNLSKGKMGDEASRAFGQFVVGRLQSIAQRRANQSKSGRTPTYLLIDEFQDYVTSSMAKILKESRKYALHLVLANQFIDDVRNAKVLQAIKTNTDIKLHGRNDADHFEHFYETMLLEKEDLLRLKEFEFYVKAGTTPSYKMKALQVPELLAEEPDFQCLLDRTKQYYTPLNFHDRSKNPQRKTPKFKL